MGGDISETVGEGLLIPTTDFESLELVKKVGYSKRPS
jgi:hypothetical protein